MFSCLDNLLFDKMGMGSNWVGPVVSLESSVAKKLAVLVSFKHNYVRVSERPFDVQITRRRVTCKLCRLKFAQVQDNFVTLLNMLLLHQVKALVCSKVISNHFFCREFLPRGKFLRGFNNSWVLGRNSRVWRAYYLPDCNSIDITADIFY